ncbi:acyl-CoA-binding domain-containing protein 6 isoform X2 [Ornithorhynchus anatinus]|uniref:acyl-CoA-binding domain-containing protein 6 isoform X2 n=1 Tax=Ornithorhynchus anatinus TaxID=9258 RepID=UPI0010A77277|nr:acyl-CoA-binding domain-containing protein 6 isoform X2 [Ornithorhynchus anatinus]
MAAPAVGGAGAGGSGGELSSEDEAAAPGEASKQLCHLFEQAAAHLQGLVQAASREQLLYLYARYKQVKVGNCNVPKPGFFDFEGKQKWEAWKALGEASPKQAMQEYVAAVRKLDPTWNPQAPEEKEKEGKVGFGGPVISSLYQEETIREEDKNIFDYCRENNIDHVTKAIKSKKVDVNIKDEEDNEGQTALHYASACEFLDIVELLLQAGADPTLRDQEGCLPEEVTECKAVSSVLQQHTAGRA